MKPILKYIGATLAGVAFTAHVQAGDQFYDLDTDPAALPGFIFSGNNALINWISTGGNPAAGGYVAITDAINGQTLGIIFPSADLFTNVDNSVIDVPIKAFKLECDLRIGNANGCDGRPADGFSISLARANDPVLYWATNTPGSPVFRAYAGGDGCAQANQSASNPAGCDSGTAENGTKTGLAIAFDAWTGNELPNTAANPNCVDDNDVEGIAIRVDDKTLLQVPMSTRNGSCDDTNSVQTGPYDPANPGSPAGLCWARLTAELDTNNQVTVTYKGRVMLDHYQLTNFPTPLNARLILAGRTGGCNQNTHIDNIRITTVPAVQATLGSIVGSPNAFTFTLIDFGPSQVTNVQQVLLDNVDVTSSTVISKAGGVTTGVYTQGTRFTPNSQHNVRIIVQDTVPQTLTFNTSFTVPNWILMPSALAIPFASVDTTKPGFTVNSYQSGTVTPQPNQLNWTEEQILGYWGPNIADLSGATGGLFNHTGAMDFANALGSTGRFPTDNPFTTFGQLGNPDNNTVEFWGYVYFPTSGIYQMRFGSDDGYQISVGPHARDRMGTVLMSFNGGRGIAVNQDVRPVIVDQAGVYPMRVLFQNGGGGAAMEWYFEFDPNTFVLVNDSGTPGAIMAYRDLLPAGSAGPYVKKAVPVRNAVWVLPTSPIIVELSDGTGTRTVNTGSIQMLVDGVPQSLVVSTPSAGTTRIVRSGGTPYPGTHTITLTYADNAANNYTNVWSFNVLNALNMTALPASSAVPLGAVDVNQPGFKVYSYQTDPGGTPPGNASDNSLGWIETQLQGLQGSNAADQTLTFPNDYFPWFNAVDFDDFGGEGYFRSGNIDPQFGMDNFGFVPVGGGNNRNNNTLLIGGWLAFSNAGTYIMRITSDDAFKLSSAPGNPVNANGLGLSWFSGGRGSAGYNGGDYFGVTIPAPGAYPFRLLFGNGGGGYGVEWSFWKQLADGTYRAVLINDPVDPDTIKAYAVTTQDAPLVKAANPPPGFSVIPGSPGYPFINLRRTANFTIDLQDAVATVNTNTIVLKLGSTVIPVTITQSTNGVMTNLFTRITASGAAGWPSGFRGKFELTYQDSLGRTQTQTWDVVTEYWSTLTGGSPLGSGDPTKRGFLLNMWQVHRLGGVNIPTRIHVAEQVLAGLWTNNVIAPGPGPGGAYIFTGAGENGTNGLVNFNQDAPANAGRFNAGNGRTDRAFPGIPSALPVGNTDSIVGEVLVWVEFPTNGTYRMTVASDDGFRLMHGHSRPADKGQLIINSPGPLAGQVEAVLSGIASPQVLSRITGDLVVALGVSDGSGVSSGSTDPREGCGVTNGAALAGKIALIYRGACGFYEKVLRAQQAGAVAVVMVNDRPVTTPGDGWFPIEMGLIGNNQTPPSIPAIMIDRADGDALATAIAGGTVNVTLTPDALGWNAAPPSMVLGQADVGKGDSDVDFTVVVTQPGVYPLRLIWFEGGGGANLELYSWPDQVTRVLVNDDASAVPALKAYYEIIGQQPSLSINRQGGVVTITYTGTLVSSTSLNGPWTPVAGATSPYTVDTSAPAVRFFRSAN
jgi:hypothetical protein